MAAHPIGFVEYMEALGPDGPYGRWLRSKSIVAVVANTIFLHGGLSPDHDPWSVEDMNEHARDEIGRFDRLRRELIDQVVIFRLLHVSRDSHGRRPGASRLDHPSIPRSAGTGSTGARPCPRAERNHLEVLFELQTIRSWSVIAPDGPLWFRGFARWSPEEGTAAVAPLLERLGVVRAVVGHTVTPTREITPRFDGRVFLIDTGMLRTSTRDRFQPWSLSRTEQRSSIWTSGFRCFGTPVRAPHHEPVAPHDSREED